MPNLLQFTPSFSIPLPDRSAKELRDEVSAVISPLAEARGLALTLNFADAPDDAFTQLDETATREQGGTGLGLAITKRLVALLDGTIRVDDRNGSGSSFVVTLPSRRGATT